MSILQRFKRRRLSHTINEADAPADNTTAMTWAMGGNPDRGTPTATGTGTSEEFVGRVAGEDTDAGETGAEERARNDE
ncbi:hypothetical protein ACFV9C_38385 [Kribbella sp. NPDC059898]|uniref:hypothetical protein n=1 Tax=Kribbella sp. NPDC059898 TaxID=3346995 RepID=UPI00365EE0DA